MCLVKQGTLYAPWKPWPPLSGRMVLLTMGSCGTHFTHTCELAKHFTHCLSELHRLDFPDGMLALVGDTSFPVASSCSPTPAPRCCLPGHFLAPKGVCFGSFLFSVISLCLLSLSWMNLKRGLWPVALRVKHCYLEHVGNTGMRLSLVILSSVERDKRKSNPCHPNERHQ